jgi:hypothetical protein
MQRPLQLLFLIGIYGCSGGSDESRKKVTDDPRYVGSFKSGQIYVVKRQVPVIRHSGGEQWAHKDVDGTGSAITMLKEGQRLRITDAYSVSSQGSIYVKLFAKGADSAFNPEINLRHLCWTGGSPNGEGEVILGPDPNYLELAP